jgi:hypothetical protein
MNNERVMLSDGRALVDSGDAFLCDILGTLIGWKLGFIISVHKDEI